MNNHIDKAAQVIAHALSRHGGHGTYLDAARALDTAGLLRNVDPDEVDEALDDRYDQEHENAVLLDAECYEQIQEL